MALHTAGTLLTWSILPLAPCTRPRYTTADHRRHCRTMGTSTTTASSSMSHHNWAFHTWYLQHILHYWADPQTHLRTYHTLPSSFPPRDAMGPFTSMGFLGKSLEKKRLAWLLDSLHSHVILNLKPSPSRDTLTSFICSPLAILESSSFDISGSRVLVRM